ncbi:hypothetical protein Slin15195_G058850 [Septoria linicola]|uniref:Uncharacterized protein n=1 Tax=Septoria linicola TaxID=215465 RepID=A0A9Q9AVE7_9PEZI|nr:hypothetical protein Slin14017_G074710 [Septoria linicola]USW52566.1 hypothetical protein Slin15195_G058850 [Septoria linicola]
MFFGLLKLRNIARVGAGIFVGWHLRDWSHGTGVLAELHNKANSAVRNIESPRRTGGS